MAKGFKFIIVYNKIPFLIAAVEANSRSAPKRVAEKILMTAKSYAPVDTGTLRASGNTVSVEAGKSAEIRFDAPYAAYVEYGTYKMAAQPFLSPAFEQHKHELELELVKPLIG